MKIGNVEIKNNIFLAPMAGVTDVAFRKLAKHFGAGLTYTEMVSVKGLYYKSENTERLLQTYDGESPCAVQLFGHDPEIFESVIKSGILDKFDIIDINMGCPAPKIVKNGDGSALLNNIGLAEEIIKTCVASTNKPITVKFRKGYTANEDKLIEFAKMCERAGASAITVHPRTQVQGYSGKVDYADIKKVKESVSIPVIGNGDVVDEESYKNICATGCDAVMIGRKTVGCPEIFALLRGEQNLPTKLEIAKLHLQFLREFFSENYISKAFKRHAFGYTENFDGAVEKRKKLAYSKTLEELEYILFNE